MAGSPNPGQLLRPTQRRPHGACPPLPACGHEAVQAVLTAARVTRVPGHCPADALLTGAPEDPGPPVPGEGCGAGAVRRPGEDHEVHAGRQVPPSASQKPHPWVLPLRPEEGELACRSFVGSSFIHSFSKHLLSLFAVLSGFPGREGFLPRELRDQSVLPFPLSEVSCHLSGF